MNANLRHRDAVALAHALCGYLARQEGIRALSIKGFTLEMDHLRAERAHADADILVDPAHVSRLVVALVERGWHPRAQRDTPRIIPDHSTTLIHDSWPCDIDLHWYFPGIFSDPAQAFEDLWERHRNVEVAGSWVSVPSKQGGALIGLLHVLRYPNSSKHSLQRSEILSGLATWNREDFGRLERLAARTRAAAVLNEELGWKIGIPRSTKKDEHTDDLVLWRLYSRTHEQGSTSAWVYNIVRADWKDRPRLLKRAIYPSADELRFEYGDEISLIQRIKLRASRMQRGFRALPGALRAAVRQRTKS